MKLQILFWLIIVGCTPCNKLDSECAAIYQDFFKVAEDVDLHKFFGLTILSRGLNPDGSRFIRSVELMTESGDVFGVPGFDIPVEIVEGTDSHRNMTLFAKYYGVSGEDSEQFVRSKVEDLKSSFRHLGVSEISSQHILGEFIKFELTPDCNLYYKEDDAQLNNDWKQYFAQATKVKPSWYLVEPWRTKPVLKEHPDSLLHYFKNY